MIKRGAVYFLSILKKLQSRILLPVFLLCTFIIHAQPPLLKVNNYTKDEGLLHSYILSITQDQEGFIWVGSYGGLNRFEGHSFKSYTPSAYPGLGSTVVYSILEPAGNRDILWIGTEKGLTCLKKKDDNFRAISRITSPVRAIAEDDSGILWLGTNNNGLIRYDPGEDSAGLIPLGPELMQSKISTLLWQAPSTLWIGTQLNGLIRFNTATGSFEYYHSGMKKGQYLENNTISSLLKYGNQLIIGTWGGGLHTLDLKNNTIRPLHYIPGDKQAMHQVVTDLATDNLNNLWCSTQGGGLYCLTPAPGSDGISFTGRNYRALPNSSNTLPGNMLRKLYRDRTGNIWIGSTGGGLGMIDFYSQKFRHYLITDDSNKAAEDNNISAICRDGNGDIWYGTRNSGIAIFEMSTGRYRRILPYPANPNDPRNSVREIYRDPFNRMWVGTDLGFYLFPEKGRPALYFGPDKNQVNGLPGNEVIALCLDRIGDLWISVGGMGVCRLKKDALSGINPAAAKYEFFPGNGVDGGLLAGQVWAINTDSEGDLWFATERGMERFNFEQGSFEPILTENFSAITEVSLPGKRFYWFGTFGNGIYLYNANNGQVLVFNTKNGMPNNNINGILEDRQKNIWVSTGKGLVMISTEGLYTEGMNPGQNQGSRIRTYAPNDGLQSYEFNLNAGEQLPDGRLVFGGPKGFNLFIPDELQDNKTVFPVIIEDFRLFGKTLSSEPDFGSFVPEYTDTLTFNYRQNYFTIDFREICFTSPEKVRYAYMLEGFDQDWIDADADHNNATYTGLRAGEYTFKVRGANSDGYWGDKVTRLNIIITPPFWRRMIFRIPMLILGLSLLLLGFYFQSRLLTRKKEKELDFQKNLYEKDRLKYELEYKTKELASTTIHMARLNEKLNEIRDKLVDTRTIARTEVSSRLGSLILEIEEELKNQDNWENFELNFNLVHNDFIKRLIEAYPSLSQTDVRICAYMRMNLSSKEIAGLLNITPASLETSRIRIRKKMNLDPAVYLSHFILRF